MGIQIGGKHGVIIIAVDVQCIRWYDDLVDASLKGISLCHSTFVDKLEGNVRESNGKRVRTRRDGEVTLIEGNGVR